MKTVPRDLFNMGNEVESSVKHSVMKSVLRDFFNMGGEVESSDPQSYENGPSEHLMGPSTPKNNGEVLTKTDVP